MSHAAQIASVAQHAAQRFSHVGEPPLTFFLRHGRRFGHSLSVQGAVRSVFCGVGSAVRSVFHDAAAISVVQIRKCADK